MTGIDTLRTEERFGFGELHSPAERVLLRAAEVMRPCRSWKTARQAERLVWRLLGDVTDLRRVFESLAVLDQGTRELFYDAATRHWLAGAIRSSLSEQDGRPGLVLQHMAATCRRYVDYNRADRARRIGQRYVRFTPYPFPRSEPFLSLARGWPEVRGERNGHLRQIVAEHHPHTSVAASLDGYTAEEWEGL